MLQILGGSQPAPLWPEVHAPHAITLHQDANVYVSEMDAGTAIEVQLGAGRQAYLVTIEGECVLGGGCSWGPAIRHTVSTMLTIASHI